MRQPSKRHRWTPLKQVALGAFAFGALPFALSAIQPGEAVQVKFELAPIPGSTLERQSVFLWNGFEHNWERRVVGFRVPHRISKFSSLIEGERHVLKNSGVQSEAIARLAQSTGVDGDYMHPVIHFSTLSAPGLEVDRGQLKVSFNDRIELKPGEQSAVTQKAGLFQFRRSGLPSEGSETSALLQGFNLETHCVAQPDLPTCNGDGVWPYELAIELGACTARGIPESNETEFTCSYSLELARAWTPNKGGLPPFEIKPQNAITHYDLQIGVALLSGAADALKITHSRLDTRQASAHSHLNLKEAEARVQGSTERIYPKAALGLHALRFGLVPQTQSQEGDFQGRYIGGLTLAAKPLQYDALNGSMQVSLSQQILLPRTVIDTATVLHAGVSLIQLGSEESQVSQRLEQEGVICSDSSSQAPKFSRWVECENLGLLPNQTQVLVPLQAKLPSSSTESL